MDEEQRTDCDEDVEMVDWTRHLNFDAYIRYSLAQAGGALM